MNQNSRRALHRAMILAAMVSAAGFAPEIAAAKTHAGIKGHGKVHASGKSSHRQRGVSSPSKKTLNSKSAHGRKQHTVASLANNTNTPELQQEVIASVAAANPNEVQVISTGTGAALASSAGIVPTGAAGLTFPTGMAVGVNPTSVVGGSNPALASLSTEPRKSESSITQAPPPLAPSLAGIPSASNGSSGESLVTRVETATSEAASSARLLMHGVAEKTQAMLLTALSSLGVKYRWGAADPEDGFDCSGFVAHVFQTSLGMTLPHNAASLSLQGSHVSAKELKPGDLVFFNTMRRTFSHVGIFIGNNQFIHAPRTGKTVEIDSLNDRYWGKRFTGGRRLLGDSEAAATLAEAASREASAPITVTETPFGTLLSNTGTSATDASLAPSLTGRSTTTNAW